MKYPRRRRLRQLLARAGAHPHPGLPSLLAEYLIVWVKNRALEGGQSERFIADAMQPSIRSSRLDSARFRELLRGLETSPTSIDVALLACAQAILRPDEGPRFAQALLSCNPAHSRLRMSARVG